MCGRGKGYQPLVIMLDVGSDTCNHPMEIMLDLGRDTCNHPMEIM